MIIGSQPMLCCARVFHVTLVVGLLFCSLLCSSVCPRLPSLVLSLLSCLSPLVADNTAGQPRTEVVESASLSRAMVYQDPPYRLGTYSGLLTDNYYVIVYHHSISHFAQ